MHKKELSPYAPDIWIRDLNKLYPSLWAELRKTYEHPDHILRTGSGGAELLHNVPDWCYMPAMFPFLLLAHKYGEFYYMTHMDEIMTIGTMYTWRASKGVYRFAGEIYNALISQPLTGNLPCECLYRLPEWAVFVETPGLSFEKHPMKGFIAHLDFNLFSRGVDLQFAIFYEGIHQPKMVAMPLGEGSLSDAMDRIDQVDDLFIGGSQKTRYIGTRDDYRRTFSSMLQLLLYLCSDEPDMPEIQHPQKRRRLSGSVRPPEEPRVWDVGVRISKAIHNAKDYIDKDESDTQSVGHHARPRPHIRSAHWHTYWTGPREASFPVRKPVIKWIPPVPVAMDWKKELPTHVKILEQEA